MKKSLLIFLLLVSVLCSKAQTLTGMVVDESGSPVSFATVALLQSSDSAFVSGAVTDDAGKFALAADPRGGLLKVSCVGYDTQYREPAEGMTVILQQAAIMVEGVVVKGSRPVYRMDERGFVAPVENTVLSKLGNGMDVLNQLPFVKDEGDGVSIMGQRGDLLVYINKRKMEDWNELRQLLSSDIKTIKIVTNPGTEYGANVGTVILITTLRLAGDGLGGYVMAEGRQGKDFNSTARMNLNYRRGATDVFGGAYLVNPVIRSDHEEVFRFPYGQDNFEASSKGLQITKYSWLSMNAGFNHQPNDRQYISVQYIYDTYLNHHNHIDFENSFVGGDEKSLFNSYVEGGSTMARHRLKAYYSNQLSDKWNIAVDGAWVHNRTGEEKEERENRVGLWQQTQTENNAKSDMYALKGVVTVKVGGGELNWGMEGIYTRNRQNYEVLQQTDTGISDSDSEARQGAGSLFASYHRSIGNFTGEVGARYEYVDFRFYKNRTLQTDDSRKYHHLFPNLSFSFRTGDISVSAGYRVSVLRPNYYSLQGGVTYINSYLYSQGNPALRPEYTHRYSLSANYHDIQLTLSYAHCEDQSLSTTSLYRDKPIVLWGYQNIDVNYLSASASWSPTIGCWKPSLSVSFDKQYLDYLGRQYNQPVFSYSFKNVLTLPHNWLVVFNIDGHTQGNGNTYTARAAMIYRTELYANKSIGNWTFRLGASDLLHTYKDDGYEWGGDIYHDHKADLFQQAIYLRATYRFNPAQSKYKGGTAGQSEMNRF
ncbi:MAG: TonB-dependent receptor family protein [Prevotella sp.]|nr:TonB-dependent receptor family protein [Prevotella sp.]